MAKIYIKIYFLKVASDLSLNDVGYSMIEIPLFRSGYAVFFVWQSSESFLLKLLASVARTSSFISIPVLIVTALRKRSDLANLYVRMRMGKYHIRRAFESYVSYLIFESHFCGHHLNCRFDPESLYRAIFLIYVIFMWKFFICYSQGPILEK